MTTQLSAEPLTDEAFAPFGAVLRATPDGGPFSDAEGRLDLSAGTPRFYLMQLADKPARFAGITRHRQVTQCLSAVGGGSWLIAVAPPDVVPTPADVRAFVVPGDVALLLGKGTWHAGPFFDPPEMSFVNLELADTNVVDHDTHRFAEPLDVVR